MAKDSIKESMDKMKAAEIASSSKILNNSKIKNDKISFDTIENDKVNESDARKIFKAKMDDSKRQLGSSDWYSGGSEKPDPYDNRTSAEKASKKDVLTLSNASYGNSLLEKLVANSNHV